jgi:hypothetical protein
MASIVTVAELRSILGVSTSLYSDSYLTDVIDTAEAVILPMLVKYAEAIYYHERENSVATLYTIDQHDFIVGQSVVITGIGNNYNGTHTITEVNDYNSFSYANAYADEEKHPVIPSGLATLSSAATYVGVSAVESAVLAVSVEVFQSRIAPGGQIEGIDFTNVSPYRLGRSLFNRVSGLLGAYIDTDSMVQ